MHQTRKRILKYVEAHPGATVPEISHSLGMTAANIRYHLDALNQSGIIACHSIASSPRRGRPAFRYEINTHRSEHNLEVLADALLTGWLCAVDDPHLPEAIDKLAGFLARQANSDEPRLASRLNQAMDRLNKWQYHARWEAHAAAPHIYLTHCPYAAILTDHHELCLMDVQLLNKLLGAIVHPISLRSNTPQLDCVFVLES